VNDDQPTLADFQREWEHRRLNPEPVNYPGNWKRHLCGWIGHENIGTFDLLDMRPAVMCLRCRQFATYPEPR
jgi:hypothetical protein